MIHPNDEVNHLRLVWLPWNVFLIEEPSTDSRAAALDSLPSPDDVSFNYCTQQAAACIKVAASNSTGLFLLLLYSSCGVMIYVLLSNVYTTILQYIQVFF